MAVAGVAGKPLRLKDFLELDCDSCSAAGFRCYPRRLHCVAAPSPVRQCHLQLEAEAPRFRRSPLSHLSRSLSRRLRGGFSWRRHEEETVAPVSEPCVPPEAAASSSSDSETSESGSSSAEGKSESDFSSASSESLPHAGGAAAAAAVHEAAGSEGDDQEQLSPVAVMDFPFDDDEDAVVGEEHQGRDGGGACSPSFSDSLAQIHRRKTQLQHKIRRLGSIMELGAVDLEARFAASDSDGLANVETAPSCPNDVHGSVDVYGDHDEKSLHGLLKVTATVSAGGVDGVSERLLLDFFAEIAEPKLSSSESGEAEVKLARGWLAGTGAQWGLKDVLCRREDLMAGMERSRRWPERVGEEEERNEVGVVVASLVVDELLCELLRDLAV